MKWHGLEVDFTVVESVRLSIHPSHNTRKKGQIRDRSSVYVSVISKQIIQAKFPYRTPLIRMYLTQVCLHCMYCVGRKSFLSTPHCWSRCVRVIHFHFHYNLKWEDLYKNYNFILKCLDCANWDGSCSICLVFPSVVSVVLRSFLPSCENVMGVLRVQFMTI